MLENIYSGGDYAKLIIDGIMEVEDSFPINERMNTSLLQYWIEEIKKRADEKYNAYLIGEIDDFMFELNELESLFEIASRKHVDDTLTSLLEKDLLSMSIDENGEIVYNLSDKGRDLGNIMFGKDKLN